MLIGTWSVGNWIYVLAIVVQLLGMAAEVSFYQKYMKKNVKVFYSSVRKHWWIHLLIMLVPYLNVVGALITWLSYWLAKVMYKYNGPFDLAEYTRFW